MSTARDIVKELSHAHRCARPNPSTPTLNRIATAKMHYAFIHGHEPTMVIMHTGVRRLLVQEGFSQFELDMAIRTGSFLGMRGFFTIDCEPNQIICAR